jgi:hypothetical protein
MGVDLIAQIVTIGLVIYLGLHLRSQLRTLKSAVEAQKVTIEAQAESMKAQSAVLQDFERLNKVMQHVVAFVDPEAQLKREQAFQTRVQRDADDHFKELSKELSKQLREQQEKFVQDASHALMQATAGLTKLLCNLLPFVYPPLRQALIEAADLIPESKANLQQIAQEMPYRLITDEASFQQYQSLALAGQFIRMSLQQPPKESPAP